MKKNNRIILIFIFLIFTIFCFNSKISAAKVSGGEVQFGDGSVSVSGFLNHRRNGIDKDIKEICLYERSDAESAVDTKELIIYSDNTASVYWTGVGCKARALDERCADGDDAIQGIKNWSGNSSGYDSQTSEFDAYKWYSENDRCPAYLAQKVNGQSNWFAVSAGDTKTDYNNMSRYIQGLSGESYYSYYNSGDVTEDFSDGIVCRYSDSEDGEERIQIEFSKDGKAKVNSISDLKYGNVNVVQAQLNSRITSSTYLNIIEAEKCPKTLTSCLMVKDKAWYENVVETLASGLTPAFGAIFNLDSTMNQKLVIYGDDSIVNNFCTDSNEKYLHCIGDDNCSEISVCQAYSDFLSLLKADLDAYKSASSDNKRIALNKYNVDKSELQAYCNSELKSSNYAEGTCVEMCINLLNDLSKEEEAANLRNPYSEQKCNIGEQVVSMVYNVLKWGKYIAPVLVIILTILDFIKALAAQSDDDMKKAQGKFIRRLIVAALLFLLPLIINFALKTFGFYSSSCDITDLF